LRLARVGFSPMVVEPTISTLLGRGHFGRGIGALRTIFYYKNYPSCASRVIRPLVGALDALDRPGDCASAPTRPTPGPLQSSRSAGVRRLPRWSVAARPGGLALFFAKRSFRCHRKQCANIAVNI